MAKIDKVKEEIGFIKVSYALLVAIEVSLIGWFSQSYDDIGSAHAFNFNLYSSFYVCYNSNASSRLQ